MFSLLGSIKDLDVNLIKWITSKEWLLFIIFLLSLSSFYYRLKGVSLFDLLQEPKGFICIDTIVIILIPSIVKLIFKTISLFYDFFMRHNFWRWYARYYLVAANNPNKKNVYVLRERAIESSNSMLAEDLNNYIHEIESQNRMSYFAWGIIVFTILDFLFSNFSNSPILIRTLFEIILTNDDSIKQEFIIAFAILAYAPIIILTLYYAEKSLNMNHMQYIYTRD